MKSLTRQPAIRNGMTLVIGPETVREVAKSYGFKNVVMPLDLLGWHPEIWPFRHAKPKEPLFDISKVPIATVLVCHDSRDWALDIQVICDVLRSEGGLLGTLGPHHHTPNFKQSVPIYFSNSDFTYVNEFSVPRFAQGSFRMALEHLYHELTGHRLIAAQEFGKPFPAMYDYARQVLGADSSNQMAIFGVGDNVSSDIVGANMAGCKSVLVRTGVW